MQEYMMNRMQQISDERNRKINKIEKIKALKRPLSVYKKLELISSGGLDNLSYEDGKFFLKCFGAFLKKDGRFMLRVRIPAGQLSVEQAASIGELSRVYGEDSINITTRQQIELNYIRIEDLYSVIKALEDAGVSTFQTGIDNFRNIVTSSFDGLGNQSIITVKPLIDEMQSIFLEKEEWIGTLPHKFNTAVFGTAINDCSIYGHDCSFIVAKKGDETGFNLYLGGKVGVQAEGTGLFVRKDEVVTVFNAVIHLFKTYGFRDKRTKNRLHFLLEAVGMEAFADAIRSYSGLDFNSGGDILVTEEFMLDEGGQYDLGKGLMAVHLGIPAGKFTGENLLEAAKITKQVNGEIRLSVEQSLYIVTTREKVKEVKESVLFDLYSRYHHIYFNHQIACAGALTCAYGVIPGKSDAIEMSNYLQREVPIFGGKVRMYWSACPHGCGIHRVADIGFEGCRAKDEEGNRVNGVHIYLGGKAAKEAKEARLLYKAIPIKDAKCKVKKLMEIYRDEREEGESFESFDSRVLAKLSLGEIVEKIEVC